MKITISEAKEKIREVGLKSTMTRVSVLRYLAKAVRPLSHSDIVQGLDNQHGDQATIYRNLLSFVDKGLVKVVSNVGGVARYEFVDGKEEAQHLHPHFVCNECGIVSCLPGTTVISSLDEQWRDIIAKADLQFVGLCLQCA